MRRVIACGLFALSPLAFAATEFTDDVPLKLVQSLLRSPFENQTRLYEDWPDDFPQLNLPNEFTLLGSMDMGYSQTAVLEFPAGFADAQSRIGQILEDAGWKALPAFARAGNDSGFVSTQQPALPSRYCHDNVAGVLTVSESLLDEASLLVLNRQLTSQFSGGPELSCTEQIEQEQFNQARFMGPGGAPGGISMYLPRLEMPEPASQGMGIMRSFNSLGGGGGGSLNDWETQNQIALDWSLQQMSDHFAPQLEAQGWERESGNVGDFLANSTWTRSVEDGPQLLGILNILEIDTNNFELKFRLIRQPAREE